MCLTGPKEYVNLYKTVPESIEELVKCAILSSTAEMKHLLAVFHHTTYGSPVLPAVAAFLQQ